MQTPFVLTTGLSFRRICMLLIVLSFMLLDGTKKLMKYVKAEPYIVYIPHPKYPRFLILSSQLSIRNLGYLGKTKFVFLF